MIKAPIDIGNRNVNVLTRPWRVHVHVGNR